MTYLLGKATVDNFDHWYAEFENNESFRSEHGETGYQVYQSNIDPHELVVIFEWDDDEDPQSFFESPEMRDRMEKAGLNSKPDLTSLKLIDHKSAQTPSSP